MGGGPQMHKNLKLGVLIPCRYNSKRLPGKALKKIGDKPLIHHVYLNTLRALSMFDIEFDIFICTDSELIVDYLKKESIPFYKTSSDPINGTERIAETINKYELNYDYYIDVQGDEPFINQEIIGCVVNSLIKFNRNDDIVILPHQLIKMDEAQRESVVKLVLDEHNYVLYMSRACIPFEHKKNGEEIIFKKHLSVIGFTLASINKYNYPKGAIYKIEDIELLKLLEIGTRIFSPLSNSSTFSIDTEEDLENARKILG